MWIGGDREVGGGGGGGWTKFEKGGFSNIGESSYHKIGGLTPLSQL